MSVIIRYHCRITNALDSVDKNSLNTEDTIPVKAYHEIRRLLKLPCCNSQEVSLIADPTWNRTKMEVKIKNLIDKQWSVFLVPTQPSPHHLSSLWSDLGLWEIFQYSCEGRKCLVLTAGFLMEYLLLVNPARSTINIVCKGGGISEWRHTSSNIKTLYIMW